MSRRYVQVPVELLEWHASRDTGISSNAIAAAAYDLESGGVFGASPPWDVGDFGRCARLILRVPEVRRGVNVMGDRGVVHLGKLDIKNLRGTFNGAHRDGIVWWRYSLVWDELMRLYVAEAGRHKLDPDAASYRKFEMLRWGIEIVLGRR